MTRAERAPLIWPNVLLTCAPPGSNTAPVSMELKLGWLKALYISQRNCRRLASFQSLNCFINVKSQLFIPGPRTGKIGALP
jgi:hypothetical protein